MLHRNRLNAHATAWVWLICVTGWVLLPRKQMAIGPRFFFISLRAGFAEVKPVYMKYLIIGLIIATLIPSCRTKIPYVQLYETESTNTTKTKQCYVYDNDTLRIDYAFWADGGTVAFRIANKTNKPIYVNWFRSSFISNSLRYQYWNDKAQTQVNFNAVSSRNVAGFPDIVGYSGDATIAHIKPEKISFIPPHSYILKLGSYIKTEAYKDWGTQFTKTVEPRHDLPKYQTTVYSKHFDKQTTPLDFRNFLTLSFNEDFTGEFYIDNDFYVKSVTVMDKHHFWDDVPNPNDQHQDWRDFRNPYYSVTRYHDPTGFYLKIY